MLLPLRLSGAVWGHLLGDALGVPYEFRQPDAITEVRWGESGTFHHVPPGTWSDDGALMLALLDSLLPDQMADPQRPGGFDPEDQARRFLAWHDRGTYTPDGTVFDVGRATASGLVRVRAGAPAEEAGGTDERSNGNGSLMRSIGLALVGRDEAVDRLVEWAHRSSRITHGHPIAQATCALYVLVARRLLTGQEDRVGALTDARSALGELYEREASDFCGALTLIDAHTERHGGGYVVDSFWSAWDAFSGAASYQDTIERAIRYGHDTDTTACIAGGLAGLYWGVEGIPAEWLEGMRGRVVVQPIIDRLVETAGWRTSHGSPIRVDWVDADAIAASTGWTGRLGMTFLPGGKVEGHRAWRWRDLPTDAAALRDRHGVGTLLLLVEDGELDAARVRAAPAAFAEAGVELLRHQVEDLGVPPDAASFRKTLEVVVQRLRVGRNVAVACRGGLGRTGTTIACLLVEAGLSPEEAIRTTRAARAGTIENRRQEDFIRTWPHTRRDP